MAMKTEKEIIHEAVEKMQVSDAFLKWLNPSFIEVKKGYCKIILRVRNEFLNHVGILHGGITFSIADVAFAYASNSHNRIAVALSVHISFPNASILDDELTIIATEEYLQEKTAGYRVEVVNQNQKIIGIFNGVVFRKKELHIDA